MSETNRKLLAMNDPVAGIREMLSGAVVVLDHAGARDEALARFVSPRRRLGFTRPSVMLPLGRVWRLGVLLLDRDATVYATGSITRVTEPVWPNYQSLSAEQRRGYRAAALKGGFAQGETVNFDATVIELDATQLRSSRGPLFLRGDSALVRWSRSAPDDDATDLESYLSDRVSLLVNPPEGA